MPKRKSSFDELPFLCKMHIGVKEVDLGVNHETNMRKVFEKTRALLFNGKVAENHPKEKANGNSFEDPLHQNPILARNKEVTNGTNSCCLSRKNSPCSFCEKNICTACCRICHICSLQYCQLCSILQYSSQEETAICLSCLR